ncbi:MlaD family protein [Confluentibacter lentus]|uniref:MlaD family protein n=1 Tax=Confluentibacter lentus TaxID=1699412 RepID=UPI000C281494|nr:MlaD family protein [Confluentibacter lentus]
MNTNSQKIRLGLFVIIGTLFFVLGIYLIGQKQNMFKKTFMISAEFQNVNGLQKGNNVRYSGINIGTVKAIEMLNDSIVKVEMNIEENIVKHIRKNAVATIGSDGLVGNMIINILPRDGIAGVIENGDMIKSFSKVEPDDLLSNLSVTIKNTEILTEDLLRITNSINNGKGSLATILNDTVMSSNLNQTIKNIKQVSENASNTLIELNGLVKSIKTDDASILGLLLNDTISGNKLKITLGNLESSSVKMENSVEKLNTIIENVNSSDGAFNYIIKDTSLVNSLKSTLRNVNEGSDKFNQNMEALKHNFLTRGYFRKLEKEERKAKDN